MGQSGCCAPECITNSRKYTGPKPLVFCCSKDSREQWIRAIKTKWEGPKGPPQTIIICERHFKPELIVRTQTGPDGIGNIVTYPIKPKLVPGALPTIFPELSAALQSDAPNPRDSREERERKRQRQHAVQADMDLKTREKADILDSFQSLETEVHNRLFMWQRRPNAGAFDNLWKVDIAPGRVVLYQMDYTTDRPRVRRSVEFVSCLTPTGKSLMRHAKFKSYQQLSSTCIQFTQVCTGFLVCRCLKVTLSAQIQQDLPNNLPK